MNDDQKFVYIQTGATLMALLGILLVYFTGSWVWITLSTSAAGISATNYYLWKGRKK